MEHTYNSGAEGWNSFFMFFTVASILSAAFFYFVPSSGVYFRKGCHVIIDTVALSLKAILYAFDVEYKPKAVKFPPTNNSKHEETINTREWKQRKNKNRKKNPINYKEVNNRNGEWSTVQLYPGRGFKRDSAVNMEWNKELFRTDNDNILYPENNIAPEKFNQLLTSDLNSSKNSRKTKQDENVKKQKYERDRQVFYHRHTDEYNEEAQKLNEKLRKLRRRIRSMVSVSDKSLRELKEFEALKLINDILRNANNNKDELKHQSYQPIDDDKTYEVINVDSSRLDRKFITPTRKKSADNDEVELPELDLEGLSVNSDYFLQRPIITDRVTPILQNTLQWIFGGCQSESHEKRKT